MSKIPPIVRLVMTVSTLTLIAILLITAWAGYRLEMGIGKLIFSPPDAGTTPAASLALPPKVAPNRKQAGPETTG
jgi:hypothetical protein